MIAFCVYVTGRDARQRGKRGCTTVIAEELEGRAASRFCARRGIHTVRFGSTDYAHSSLTEGTSINVAQEHGAICLGRESSQLQHRETRDLSRMHAEGFSRDLVIRGLYFTFTISRELPPSDIYRFYPGSPGENSSQSSAAIINSRHWPLYARIILAIGDCVCIFVCISRRIKKKLLE